MNDTQQNHISVYEYLQTIFSRDTRLKSLYAAKEIEFDYDNVANAVAMESLNASFPCGVLCPLMREPLSVSNWI